MIKLVKKLVKKLVMSLKLLKSHFRKKLIYRRMQRKHHKILMELQIKPKIKVIFLVVLKSMWKVDLVFQKMLEDEYFEPLILIVPNTVAEESDMWSEYNQAYIYFSSLGYPVQHSYISSENRWIKIDELKPDIVFFTNPHELTKPEYYEDVFYNYLTCYAGYGINTSKNVQLQYNMIFHAAVWKIFVQTQDMMSGYKQYSSRRGRNVHLVIDNIVKTIRDNLNKQSENVWKSEKYKYKVIYAPHHRVSESDMLTATFIQYADFFLNLVKCTQDTILWSFKPHPHLKSKLYRLESWGKERTDNYYKFWEESSNTQLNESDYISLFLQSDAMILDSYSFLAEYTFTEKPMLYLMKDSVEKLMSGFGLDCLDTHYKAYNEQDILKFIENVRTEQDPLLVKRQDLIRDYCNSLGKNNDLKVVLDILKQDLRGGI